MRTPSASSATLRVEPGDLQVSNDPAAKIGSKALGSAMALSAYDPEARVGGLLLFMYPDSEVRGRKSRESPGFFADTGIPRLITAVCDAGASRARLVFRLGGGCGVMDPENTFNACEANRTAALGVLAGMGLSVAAEHVGGHEAMSVQFNLRDGKLTLAPRTGQEIDVA